LHERLFGSGAQNASWGMKMRMEKPRWHVRSRTYVIESEFLRLRKDEIELPDGKRIPDYFVRESPGFVIVFALTNDDRVVVVHQYRYGIDRITLELPAGAMEDEEHPLLCAQRELIEETGFTAEHWEEVLVAPSDPVRSNSMMHAFIARDAQRTHEQDLDDGEEVEWELLAVDEFKRRLHDGAIGAVPSIAVAYAALERLGRL
jgi:ADP-ribose pyrophosphatase